MRPNQSTVSVAEVSVGEDPGLKLEKACPELSLLTEEQVG
jgi:hypothetical protein